MRKINLVLMIFLIIFQKNCLTGQGGSIAELEYGYKQFNSIIYLTAGLPFAAESKDFFQNYSSVLEGLKEEFQVYPIACLGTKFQFWKKVRIGFETEYFMSKFNDAFVQKYSTQDETIYRAISEEIKISSIPALALFEFSPHNQQFRTYAGCGLGFSFTNISWNERVESSDDYDARQGGNHFNEMLIDPMFKLYTGLELGFDKDKTENFLGSFIIELKYTYYYRDLQMFSAIKNQFEELPSNIDESVTILPGFLGLYMGLTFNFNRRI